MLYQNIYKQDLSEWDAFYSSFTEKAEDCYLRWINADEELTEAETRLAIEYQSLIEGSGEDTELIEVEIPPETEISPDEFQAFLRIANKLYDSGLSSFLNVLIGNNDPPYLRLDSKEGKENL